MPTPAAPNIRQDFQTCPEGKIINPETGNCVNDTVEEAAVKTCPEGQYLNTATGRCKKIPVTASTELTPCAEGYERNPETNRCRKIRATDEIDYPVVENPATESYDNPKIFIATWALIIICVCVIGYVVFQFRGEIAKFFRRLSAKL